MKTTKYLLLSSLVLTTIFMGGCATSYDHAQYQSAHQVIEKPTIITPPISNNYRLSYGSNPALKRAFNQYIRTGKAPDIITDGFVQYAYNSGQQVVIATTPYQQTVITLEPGERFTNVSTADPQRWTVAVAYSGVGANKTVNVLVTPAVTNISTNIVITTDKRMYNLKLVSTNTEKYVRDVRFWYPEEMVAAANNATAEQAQDGTVAQLPNISLNNLYFGYSISPRWGGPHWKPVRVFDDGKQTFIQMPSGVSSGDLPALFVTTGNTQQLVNYRYKQSYFIVDKLFQQAQLISGVGSNQQRVTITRNAP